jgi:hypothetical protein
MGQHIGRGLRNSPKKLTIAFGSFQQAVSRVLRNPQTIEMTWPLFSTPCVKTGFVPNLLSRLGRDKSEGAGC